MLPRALRLGDDSLSDEVGEEQWNADDFDALDGLAVKVAEVLLVAGEQVVRVPGDRSAEDGAVFFRELHAGIEELQRHQIQAIGKSPQRSEAFWGFGGNVSLGFRPGLGACEEIGVAL